MVITKENKYAFKIHKTLLDIGNEVIQLSIEHKIKENEPVSDFLRRQHNNMNGPFLRDLKRTLDDFLRNNSNEYPDNLKIFDISSKITIAQNLILNSSLTRTNEIEMDNLNFSKCLNNLRVIRNKFYGHLKKYEIIETEYNEILEYLKILIKELVHSFDPNAMPAYEERIIQIQNINIIPAGEFDEFKIDIENLKSQIQLLNDNQCLLNKKLKEIEERINTNNKEIGFISDNYAPDTRCFIRRDQDEEILKKLVNKDDTDIIVLTGIGGIGKTILASYLANRLFNEFNYKYKWFDCNCDLNEKYKLILKKEFNQIENNKDYIISLLCSKLNDEKSNILFVFDNILNIEEKKDYILKLPSKVKIILTTRNQDLKISNVNRKSKKFVLNVLNKSQAKYYLIEIEEIRNLNLSDEKLNEILNDLMPNDIISPLKLDIAVKLVVDNETERLGKIIDLLKTEPTDQVYIQLVIESFKDNKLTENILRYFSLLNTEFVEKELIENIIEFKDISSLELLKRQSLIIGLRKNDVYGYRIHDFIVETIHERTKKDEITAAYEHIIQKMISLIDSNFDPNIYNKENENLFTHLDSLLKYYMLNKEKTKKIHYNIAHLFKEISTKMSNLYDNYFEKQLKYSKESMEIFKIVHINQPYNLDLAKIYYNVGIAYKKTGDYEMSLSHLFKSLNIHEKLKEDQPFHSDLATIYFSIAMLYKHLGDYENHLGYLLKLLKINKDLNNNFLDQAEYFSAVALVHECIGDNNRNLEYLLKSLEIHEKRHQNHLNLLVVYNNVAMAYLNNGNYEKCREYSFKSLEIGELIFKSNPNHPYMAKCYNCIAFAYLSNGNIEMYIEYSLKSLEIHEKTYKDHQDHPYLDNIYNHASLAYSKCGDYKKQLEYSLKSLEILEKKNNFYNEKRLENAFTNVSLAYDNNKNHEKQLEYSLKSLEIGELIFKNQPDHLDKANIYDNVSIAYKNIGNDEKYLEFMLKSLEIREKIHKTQNNQTKLAINYNNVSFKIKDNICHEYTLESPILGEKIRNDKTDYTNIAKIYNNVSYVHRNNRNYKKFLEFSIKSLEISEKFLKNQTDHSELEEKIFRNVSEAYRLNDNFEKSLEYSKKSLEIGLKLYKDNHPDLADIYENVATAYMSKDENENNLIYLLKSVEIREKIYQNQPNHPDLAKSYNNIALAYNYIGNYENLLRYSLKSLGILEKLYKDQPFHRDLATVYYTVSLAYMNDKNHEKHLKYSFKSLVIQKKLYEDQPDHSLSLELVRSYDNVSLAYRNNGKYEKQLEFLLKSLELSKIIYKDNPYNLNLATIYYNVSMAYKDNKNNKKFLEYSLIAFDISKEIYKDHQNHPNLVKASDLCKMAYSYNNNAS